MNNKKKLWGGRFTEQSSGLLEAYTESVSYDWALYKQDIAGSMAHARMLGECGIIDKADVEQILEGLKQILSEIEADQFIWREELEDVHMNIESRLTEIIGEAGKRLHTARSRNDQVALDFRLYVSDSLREWHRLCLDLIEQFTRIANEHKNTLLPGYTHLQAAQAVSLAQHLLAYASMFKRDALRISDCEKRVRICTLGAAALAGTTYPIEPQMVASELSMYATFENSMDAVSDRDFVIESLFCASTIMAHLSRFCEEIILWSNPAFNFIKLSDKHSTGSSIMPQKKNPDIAELMRGKTARVYANLQALLTIVKGLPLTYNRDLQEDKEPFFDSHKTVKSSLAIMHEMLGALTFNETSMHKALKLGYINATELADYLVTKGIAFREAHHITGQTVAYAEALNKGLEDLNLQELKQFSRKIEKDIYQVLDYQNAVNRRSAKGGTSPVSVEKQIISLREWINKQEHIWQA